MKKIISDVAEVIDSLHKTPQYQNVGIPMVRVVDVNNSFLKLDDCFVVDEETYKEHSKNHVPQVGDTIITRVGSYGMIAYVDTDKQFCLGQNIAIVSPQKDKEFLYYYLLSPYIQRVIYGNSGGSSYKCIGLEEIKKLPYIDEGLDTNKIGKLLYSIDKKIVSNNAINAELESMTKTIYGYWFLQFDFPDENGKPYKSSGGKMVWNEELNREIPEGWKCDMLMEYISLTKGISYTSKNIESGKGVPMINLASIDINRNYKPNELKFYDGEYNRVKEVSSEDMLIACTDLTRNANIVGSPILVPNTHEKYLYSMDLAKLDLVTEELEPMYLYMTLRTEYYHNYIKGFATGTNVMHLNTNGISWFRVCFPPIKMQKKFSLLVKEIHEMKCKLIKENQELTSLRDFLLPLLMNGQVGFE